MSHGRGYVPNTRDESDGGGIHAFGECSGGGENVKNFPQCAMHDVGSRVGNSCSRMSAIYAAKEQEDNSIMDADEETHGRLGLEDRMETNTNSE